MNVYSDQNHEYKNDAFILYSSKKQVHFIIVGMCYPLLYPKEGP